MIGAWLVVTPSVSPLSIRVEQAGRERPAHVLHQRGLAANRSIPNRGSHHALRVSELRRAGRRAMGSRRAALPLLDREQLNLEDQLRVRWHEAGHSAIAVREMRADMQTTATADPHPLDAM